MLSDNAVLASVPDASSDHSNALATNRIAANSTEIELEDEIQKACDCPKIKNFSEKG